MDSICSGLKEEDKWEELQLHSKRIKKGPSSLEHQIKDNCSFAIGHRDRRMKLAQRMIRFGASGISKGASGLSFPWT